MNCPDEHGEMSLKKRLENIAFRGKEFQVEIDQPPRQDSPFWLPLRADDLLEKCGGGFFTAAAKS